MYMFIYVYDILIILHRVKIHLHSAFGAQRASFGGPGCFPRHRRRELQVLTELSDGAGGAGRLGALCLDHMGVIWEVEMK